MNRIVQPELLDELPPTDPRAIHSRQDLRRVNALMGNARALKKFLVAAGVSRLHSMAEIGAGDGNIAFQIAKALPCGGRALLVDRQPIPQAQSASGWTFEWITADVFDWLRNAPQCDVVFANLFLHHFQNKELRELLAAAAERCRIFAAAEPLRAPLAEFAAGKLSWIGCNEVTCHDAVISVRAGFNDSELSDLWPDRSGWTLTERRTGLFTHFFGAIRK